MARELRGRLVALALAVIVAAAPFGGAVCTMACGDSGSACCCTSAEAGGEPVFSNPSCCTPDLENSPDTTVILDRGSRSSFSPLSLQISRAQESGAGARALSGPALYPVSRGEWARPSPLYLLNATFII